MPTEIMPSEIQAVAGGNSADIPEPSSTCVSAAARDLFTLAGVRLLQEFTLKTKSPN